MIEIDIHVPLSILVEIPDLFGTAVRSINVVMEQPVR